MYLSHRLAEMTRLPSAIEAEVFLHYIATSAAVGNRVRRGSRVGPCHSD